VKRPIVSFVVALLLVAICAVIVLHIRESQAPLGQVAKLIEARVRQRDLSFPKSDRSERARNWALVSEFYRKRSYRPAWSDGRGPDRQSYELAEAIRAATLEGLNPKDNDICEPSPERARLHGDGRSRLDHEPAGCRSCRQSAGCDQPAHHHALARGAPPSGSGLSSA